MKLITTSLFLTLWCCVCTAASVPIRWEVDTSRITEKRIDAYHGETLDIEVSFKSTGQNLNLVDQTATLYFQTNGMQQSWWTAPGTVSSNVARVTFTPAMDPGSKHIILFIGLVDAQSNLMYRANALITMRDSPGYRPNFLSPPIQYLDYSLLTVENAPFYTKDETDERITTISHNVVTSTVPPWALANQPPESMSDNALILRFDNVITTKDGEVVNAAQIGALPVIAGSGMWLVNGSIVLDDISSFVGNVEAPNNMTIKRNGQDIVYGLTVNGVEYHGDVTIDLPADNTDTLNSLSNRVDEMAATVSSWNTYWAGDDVRVTVTNYYGSRDMPHLYLEEKMSSDGTNFFKVVWDEMTRWNAFLSPYNSFTNAVMAALNDKADRAWGFYDSHTGNYAPDGFTWISSPYIAIAGGLAYQRTITSEGAVFVLCSNGLVTQTGGTVSNGFFRVSDDEGNSLFEIVKGDKRMVGAVASSTQVSTQAGVTHLTVMYNVVADAHPIAYFTASLIDPEWKSEEDADCLYNVSWTGSSGAWQLEFWEKSPLQCGFVKAEYEVGGNTRIKQNAVVEMSTIYLNGTEYRLGTAQISGSTVLTLTPVN